MERHFKKNSGASLIEVLLSVGIFSVVLLASLAFFSQVNQDMKRQSYSQTRTRLFQGLIYTMGMHSTLRGSMVNDGPNGLLWKGIRNGLVAPPANPVPMALFLPVVVGSPTLIKTSGKISGPTGAPLLYNLEGGNCEPSVSNFCDPSIYSIAISTSIMPICPPDYDYYRGLWSGPIYPNGLKISTACNRAHYFKIYYRFEPTPGAPESLQFSPVTGSIMVNATKANTAF